MPRAGSRFLLHRPEVLSAGIAGSSWMIMVLDLTYECEPPKVTQMRYCACVDKADWGP